MGPVGKKTGAKFSFDEEEFLNRGETAYVESPFIADRSVCVSGTCFLEPQSLLTVYRGEILHLPRLTQSNANPIRVLSESKSNFPHLVQCVH